MDYNRDGKDHIDYTCMILWIIKYLGVYPKIVTYRLSLAMQPELIEKVDYKEINRQIENSTPWCLSVPEEDTGGNIN